MATFETRVQGLVGFDTDTKFGATGLTNLSQYLTDGVNDIINKLKIINPGILSLFATQTAVGVGGSYIDGDILSVYGDETSYDRPAAEVDPATKGLIVDPSSIFFQSSFNPVFYREGKKVTIVPNGGTVIHVTKPAVNHADETILEVPEQYYHLICTYAAVKSLRALLDSKETTFAAIAYTSPGELNTPVFSSTFPDDLVVPNFPYIPSSVESVYEGTPGIVKADAVAALPVYSAPVLNVPVLSAITDVSMPDPPVPPTIEDLSFAFTENPPTYTKPSLVLPGFPAFDDLTFTGTANSVPVQPPTPALVAEAISEHSIGTLPAPPIYSSPKLLGVVEELMETAPTVTSSSDLGNTPYAGVTSMEELLEMAWSYIQGDEDPELAQLAHAQIGQVVNLFSTQMTDNLNGFNARVQEYNQEVQKVMQQSTLDRAKKDKQSDMNWQAAQTQYSQELAEHGAQVALYQAEINKQVQLWQINNITYKMAKWNSEVGHAVQVHAAEMSSELNKFNEADKLYQMEWQRSVQNSTLSTADKANQMAMFDKDMSRYAADINSITQRYTQNELLKKWEVYKFDYGQALAKHAAEMTNSMNSFNEQNAELQMELQIAQGNASQIHAALTSKMATETELAKHNALQQAAADLNKWTQDLANYQAKIGKYGADINAQNSEFSAIVAKYGQDVTDAMNTFNTQSQVKIQEYQWIEARMKQLEAEYHQGIGLMAQPKEKGD